MIIRPLFVVHGRGAFIFSSPSYSPSTISYDLSDIRPLISDFRPPISDLRPLTSLPSEMLFSFLFPRGALRPQSPDFRPPTSDICLFALRPPPSVLCLLTSDLRPLSSFPSFASVKKKSYLPIYGRPPIHRPPYNKLLTSVRFDITFVNKQHTKIAF